MKYRCVYLDNSDWNHGASWVIVVVVVDKWFIVQTRLMQSLDIPEYRVKTLASHNDL